MRDMLLMTAVRGAVGVGRGRAGERGRCVCQVPRSGTNKRGWSLSGTLQPRRGGPVPWCTPCSARSGASPGPGLPRDPRSARRARRCAARRCLGARRRCSPARCKGTRRVQLVWRDGRDVSTLYGREGGVVVLACAVCRSDVPSRGSRLRAWRCVSRRRSDGSIASSVSWAARAAASRAAPASTRASASASRSAAASRASSVSR